MIICIRSTILVDDASFTSYYNATLNQSNSSLLKNTTLFICTIFSIKTILSIFSFLYLSNINIRPFVTTYLASLTVIRRHYKGLLELHRIWHYPSLKFTIFFFQNKKNMFLTSKCFLLTYFFNIDFDFNTNLFIFGVVKHTNLT